MLTGRAVLAWRASPRACTTGFVVPSVGLERRAEESCLAFTGADTALKPLFSPLPTKEAKKLEREGWGGLLPLFLFFVQSGAPLATYVLRGDEGARRQGALRLFLQFSPQAGFDVISARGLKLFLQFSLRRALTSSGRAGDARRDAEGTARGGMLEEALLSGAAEGLLLIQDAVACEGRSLLKSFVAAAARRAESIHVLGFDLPELEFKAGMSTEVTSRISFHDAFPDPLGWSGRGSGLTLGEFSASELASRLAATSQGSSAMIVLDSLSWLLLRLPFPSVCQVLAQLPRKANTAGLKIVRIVALIHGDLHPPAQLDVLKTLARLVVTLQPGPGRGRGGDGIPQTAVVLHRKRGNRLLEKTELFSLLPGFGFKSLGELPPKGVSREDEAEEGRETAAVDPTARLTFNLRLTEAERQARESVPLPYQFSQEKKSSLLQTSTEEGKIYYEPDAADDFDDEDPDDDLDV